MLYNHYYKINNELKEQENRKINPSMFENKSYWSKRVHEALLEVFWRYDFVKINFSSWCLTIESFGCFLGSRIKNEVLRELLKGGSGRCVYKDYIPEPRNFTSSVFSCILRSRERMSSQRNNFFKAKGGGFCHRIKISNIEYQFDVIIFRHQDYRIHK